MKQKIIWILIVTNNQYKLRKKDPNESYNNLTELNLEKFSSNDMEETYLFG
jgi:hypothetical protein